MATNADVILMLLHKIEELQEEIQKYKDNDTDDKN